MLGRLVGIVTVVLIRMPPRLTVDGIGIPRHLLLVIIARRGRFITSLPLVRLFPTLLVVLTRFRRVIRFELRRVWSCMRRHISRCARLLHRKWIELCVQITIIRVTIGRIERSGLAGLIRRLLARRRLLIRRVLVVLLLPGRIGVALPSRRGLQMPGIARIGLRGVRPWIVMPVRCLVRLRPSLGGMRRSGFACHYEKSPALAGKTSESRV